MPGTDFTRILDDAARGDPGAAGRLLPLVYAELRKLAAQRLARESPGQTLQATALVHEAYLRLVDGDDARQWNSRGHFFGAAAEAMRRIVIERARRRKRVRHGGGRRRLDLDLLDSRHLQLDPPDDDSAEELLALDEALAALEREEPDAASVVKLRYFTGLTVEEAAAAVGVSVRTANRHWVYAKAWLFQKLTGEVEGEGGASAG
jgi:RNA polymerase sigma factor (TIGR02999 family)